MISGIKRQPRRGPMRRVSARLENDVLLECGHRARAERPSRTPRSRRARHERRKCGTCFELQRRRDLEAEARAV